MSATLAPGKCDSHRRCGHLSGKYCHKSSSKCVECPDTLSEVNTLIKNKISIDNDWPYTCDSLDSIENHTGEKGLGMECSEHRGTNGCDNNLFCYKHSTSPSKGRCLRCSNCRTHGSKNSIGGTCTNHC